jgi:hypothetical protein
MEKTSSLKIGSLARPFERDRRRRVCGPGVASQAAISIPLSAQAADETSASPLRRAEAVEQRVSEIEDTCKARTSMVKVLKTDANLPFDGGYTLR